MRGQTRRIVQLRDVRSADLELWFGGEARAWALLGSAVALGPENGRKVAGSATPEDAIDAGRLTESDRPGHCRGTARCQAQRSKEAADEVAIGAVAGLKRQATRPARGAFSFERTTTRNRGFGGLIIEIVHGDLCSRISKGMTMWWFDKDKPKEVWTKIFSGRIGDIEAAHKIRHICRSANDSAEKIGGLADRPE